MMNSIVASMNGDAWKLVGMSIFSLLSAQFLKFIIKYFRSGNKEYSLLVSSGGMPSSHTAIVSTLVVSIGLFQQQSQGYLDEIFVVALALAAIVIHDALNVRLEAEKHARVLNKLIDPERLEEFGIKKVLKEDIGHVPAEIIFGAIWGVLIAFVGFWIL